MSRKSIERENRKQYILDAARRLLDEQSIENTSMDDIADASEYTRRTLYSYFRSRDEISLSLLVQDLQQRWREQKQALSEAETGLARIKKWADTLYSYTLRFPHSIRLQVYWDFKGIDRDLISDETFEAFERINEDLAEGLREIFNMGVADGSLRPDLPVDMTISQFLYTYRSILNRALSTSYSFASFEPEEYVRHYLENFYNSISNEGVSQNETA